MSKPVVIVGASMGGLRMAEALRRFGYAGPITVIGDEPHAPYNRPPLSKEVLAAEVSHEAVAFPQRPATADVNWVLGTRAVSADLDHHTVTDSNGEIHPYGTLVVATGLRPKRLHVANSELAGRHAVRTLDDAIALRADLQPGAKVVIVGAGFIGCEVAATARKLGCEVTIVGPGSLPMLRPLGHELAAEMMRRHVEQGVTFRMKTNAVDLVGETRVTAVVLDDGTTLDCDVLVESIGSHANTEWLEGCDLDLSSGVLTDSSMRALRVDGTPWETVFAIGDVARFPNPTFGDESRRIEHWNIPTDTAKRAAQVITAGFQSAEDLVRVASERFAPIPSFWSDQYDNHLLAYGLTALADESRLLDGDISADCVFGYYRRGEMVGVCGIGLRSVVQGYRAAFA
jgi:NADPH-dependent 2,4-dienoyl-CoA reductase/sulfur reductase-like enzyme